MHNLPGNPFVLVLNLQIPGDPPVSIVFYFLVPTTFYPGRNPSDGLDATREMFRKLIDCPITPPVEENQAYLDEVNELGLGRTVRQDSDEPVRIVAVLCYDLCIICVCVLFQRKTRIALWFLVSN